ncbi:MAG: hypothetical protein ABI067_06735 [Leifsonia sp.]
MAIKKRTPADPQVEAAIDAFGDAADQPAVGTRPATPRQPRAAATVVPEKIAKTLLIRYSDDELPLLLAEVAGQLERSQHATAVRALRRGLEAMNNENRR